MVVKKNITKSAPPPPLTAEEGTIDVPLPAHPPVISLSPSESSNDNSTVSYNISEDINNLVDGTDLGLESGSENPNLEIPNTPPLFNSEVSGTPNIDEIDSIYKSLPDPAVIPNGIDTLDAHGHLVRPIKVAEWY